jgi:hypothetical protein
MSQHNLFKVGKMGMLPGDLSKQTKARMLESNIPFNVFSHQRIGQRCLRLNKREHNVKVKAQFKRRANRDVQEQLHG